MSKSGHDKPPDSCAPAAAEQASLPEAPSPLHQLAAEAAIPAGERSARALWRAAQTLRAETQIAPLRDRLHELLVPLTGATTLTLAVRRDSPKGWLVSASDQATPMPLEDAARRGLLPLAAFRQLERTGAPLSIEDAHHDQRADRDRCGAGGGRCALLLVPAHGRGVLEGVLLLASHDRPGAFSDEHLELTTLVAGELAPILERTRLQHQLEQCTRELHTTQVDLATTAQRAGTAEIATNVLHNVGNVLNSVNIAAGVIRDKLHGSKLAGLSKAVQLITEHSADLGSFFDSDERGKRLPFYLQKLAEALNAEHYSVIEELGLLTKSIDHIKDIVATQQSYASSSGGVEMARVGDLIEDAVRINAGALARHDVQVVTELTELPPLPLDRHRVLQILVNLISNAKYAMTGVPGRPHLITIRLEPLDTGRIRVQVIDNGEGIPAENLGRIFTHGFTTRKEGHGFGLHSCLVAARAMGAKLLVHSEGRGLGATFTLEFPAPRPERAPD